MARTVPVPHTTASVPPPGVPARVKVLDPSGAVVEVETSAAVATVLRDAGPRPTEVPFTDLLPRTRKRRPDGARLDPDRLGVYAVPREAALMRRVLDRMLIYYHDRQGRPVEVLTGYRATLADTGAQPREATVTEERRRRDAERARAWMHPGRAAGAPLAVVPAPTVGTDGLAGGIGPVTRRVGMGKGKA